MNLTSATAIMRNKMDNYRPKRILFCTESTSLNTGYASYSKEILTYLHSTNKYIIGELASYVNRTFSHEFPWEVYGVMPTEDDSDEAKRTYSSSSSNAFGEFRFAEACLKFMPDIVCDIRDFWMLEFQQRCPFRPFYNWVIMPTVDAAPQASNWLMTYSSAEACLSYSDWAGDVLKDAGLKNYKGSAPPSAHRGLTYQYDKREQLKSEHKNLKDKFVIGTVMRNQRRKLYPDLFQAFSKFLSKVDNPEKYVLYCHTSFPDMGWDIPEILIQNGISNKVFFTYICKETGKVFPHQFTGPEIPSPFSENNTAVLTNVKNGVTTEQFNSIYGLFDLYIQYANSEGFGLPQVEAAACGVPVMATDYSAMKTVVRKLGGTPLKPKALYKEMETGCMRAVPDNEYTSEKIKEFFNLTQGQRDKLSKETYDNFMKHFRWENSGKKWEETFDELPIKNLEETWMSPPRVIQPEGPMQDWQQKTVTELVNHLFNSVLCEPERCTTYTYARMLRDLKYGFAYNPTTDMYFNDSSHNSAARTPETFTYEKAYNICYNIRKQINEFEIQRANLINQIKQGI